MTPPIRGLVAIALASCGGAATHPAATAAPPEASADWDRDILDTALTIDLASRAATATITLAGSASTGASFEVGDLAIASVVDGAGEPLRYLVHDAQLDVGVPASTAPAALVVTYHFSFHRGFAGANQTPALTLTWPYHCGNLFPCKTRQGPADGTRFTLELSGEPDGRTAVYPTRIDADAPAYMLAWAIDDYTELPLGSTAAGTAVSMWHLPGGEAGAAAGGAHLVAAFDWLEQHLGPYLYGDHVGSVAARWGAGQYGGMEHHPYWHVGASALGDEEVNVHEAAHGWFGNGIRLRCWEDFVLSEGTVTYLAARVLGEVGGQVLGDTVWADYQGQLDGIVSGGGGGAAWPASCGEVDILERFSNVPYIKGAFFYRAVGERIGVTVLDDVLGAFYAAHAGGAAGMQDLLDLIEAETGWDPGACADKWLRAETVPIDRACP